MKLKKIDNKRFGLYVTGILIGGLIAGTFGVPTETLYPLAIGMIFGYLAASTEK